MVQHPLGVFIPYILESAPWSKPVTSQTGLSKGGLTSVDLLSTAGWFDETEAENENDDMNTTRAASTRDDLLINQSS
ncbi:hypothetical protein [Paenibacillus periandrae]|uniref:hypothetical protein n=1 Tax=Paenibacillus periandrae TaxID=1761741 RepID=UPI001F091C1B|nr:hypothetical protein [Paenibacillus periandrae]